MTEHNNKHRHNDELHIASLIVHVKPEHVEPLLESMNDDPTLEVHATDPAGKVVVVCEHKHHRAILDTVERLEHTPGVLGCVLVYHEVMEAREAGQELIAHNTTDRQGVTA
ncbi:chaperone NapD [Saccharospirillum salsuginis]|uniref:Chaperone NapD n=1 Tax=Saccharospirillum salsuginis TaxID=418750 RepID=A0A918JZR2_9GAMM|nr:chaperone NapD [Saccharospirillum salsuginis]GGX38764.1 hypothetical protein GCM10007392_01230 [Saccharospirillum salsuginis]